VKQEKRLQIFLDFCARKEAVLFATDVAGRGLDFPEVDWVIQLDCPEDVASYIHRVGRTARNESKGKSLLLLSASEASMAELIRDARVPVKKIQMNKAKHQPLSEKLAQQVSFLLLPLTPNPRNPNPQTLNVELQGPRAQALKP
jgi:ATP-dependent RNA helicase DDX10/DBP4